MFNLLINFCVFVFIFYAVGRSARTILFGSRRKKRAYSHGRAVRRRKAKVIKLNTNTTKRPLRKKPQRLFVLNRFKASPDTLFRGRWHFALRNDGGGRRFLYRYVMNINKAHNQHRRGGLKCPPARQEQNIYYHTYFCVLK